MQQKLLKMVQVAVPIFLKNEAVLAQKPYFCAIFQIIKKVSLIFRIS